MKGPLWEKLRVPPSVIDGLLAGDRVLSPVVIVDDEIFLVESDGKIVYALRNNEELVPGVDDAVS